MSSQNDSLKGRLSSSSELTITTTGRKSARPISLPIWFVLDGDSLFLLPVKGSATQWYKNLLKNPEMRIAADASIEAELRAQPVSDPKQVSSVVEKFRAKYGAADVKRYYSNFDAAVVAELR